MNIYNEEEKEQRRLKFLAIQKEKRESLKTLEMHETLAFPLAFGSSVIVTKVSGGFLYTYETRKPGSDKVNFSATTFVPSIGGIAMKDEFKLREEISK